MLSYLPASCESLKGTPLVLTCVSLTLSSRSGGHPQGFPEPERAGFTAAARSGAQHTAALSPLSRALSGRSLPLDADPQCASLPQLLLGTPVSQVPSEDSHRRPAQVSRTGGVPPGARAPGPRLLARTRSARGPGRGERQAAHARSVPCPVQSPPPARPRSKQPEGPPPIATGFGPRSSSARPLLSH